MTGLELITARRLGLNPIVVVINNGVYGSLRTMGHQKASFVEIGNVSYAAVAQALGGRGIVVETGEQFGDALRSSLEADTFSVLDVRIAPDDGSPALRRLGELFARTLKG